MVEKISITIETLADISELVNYKRQLDQLKGAGADVSAGLKQISNSAKQLGTNMKIVSGAARVFRGDMLSILFFAASITRALSKIGTTAIAEFKRATESTSFYSSALGRLSLGFTVLRIALGEAMSRVLEPFADWLNENLDKIIELTSNQQLSKFGFVLFATAALAGAFAATVLGITGIQKAVGLSGVGGAQVAFAVGIGFALINAFEVSEDLSEGNFAGAIVDALQAGAGLAAATGNMKAAGALIAVSMGLQILSQIEGFDSQDSFLDAIAGGLMVLGGAVFFKNPALGAALFAIGFSLRLIGIEGLDKLKNIAGGRKVGFFGTNILSADAQGGSGTTGSRQFGGIIPATGLYKMHSGEMVSNSRFNSSVNINTGPVSSSVNINRMAQQVSNIIMKDAKRYVTTVNQYG